jgi:membrane protein implicated in regulation of membrane protease activity
MFMNWIIDHIPIWGWVVIIGVPVGALLYFFGPILLPLWRMLPLPVRLGIMAVGAAFLAFMGGRYRGRANAEDEQRRREAQAIQKRTEVDHDVDILSDKGRQDKLRDRWTRD